MPTNTIRVTIPPYDATTDTDPDHYALVGDEDWVLIKEKERDSITIAASGNETITHDLGYVPLVYVFGNLSGDEWKLMDGNDNQVYVSTTELIIYNNTGSSAKFKYFIFYDDQV